MAKATSFANKSNKSLNVTIAGTAPSSATAAGDKGDIAITSSNIYVCVAKNTWKKVAISTF